MAKNQGYKKGLSCLDSDCCAVAKIFATPLFSYGTNFRMVPYSYWVPYFIFRFLKPSNPKSVTGGSF